MRRIGVLTSDFALYHDLVRELRERNLSFVTLAFGERPGLGVGVIVTSWRDVVNPGLPDDVPIVAVSVDRAGREDVAGALAQATRVLEGVAAYRELVVGVDSGQRPGVAVLADGRLVHAKQVYRTRDVGEAVETLLGQFPHERAVVRVGHGAPLERDEILRAIWPLHEDGVRIEVVNETGSTLETGAVDLPPDVAAAIHIARLTGRLLRRPPRPAAEPVNRPRRSRPS